jgi:hypothetical protein
VAKNKPRWKGDVFVAVKLARQNLFKYSGEVIPTMGMLLISTHILDPFRTLQLFRKWDNGMDIHSENETSYSPQ